ncbi:MAG: sterol desaturase family protein, partial [Leptospirales bacterium]|nr:sterol desaturase family protein [Leptospirales bacterium]
EEYNLTVALRQGAVQGFFSTMFYFPLAFAGFPPVMFITLSQFNTIYQFWIHTKAIGKMGFLETFLNTPSHHRVHHGKNPMYIDKNYAGTLIIWDKMFGSFKEETEEVVFGTIKPLASWNPVWAQVHYFIELFQKSWKAPYFLDKIKVWFKGPGWLPRGMQYDQFMADPAYTEDGMKKGIQAKYPPKYKTTIPRALNAYTVVQFFSILGFALFFLATESLMSFGTRLMCGAFVLVTLTAIGGIFENKRWAHILEIHRLFFAAIALLVNFEQGIWLALIPVAFAVIFYSLVFREPQTAQT